MAVKRNRQAYSKEYARTHKREPLRIRWQKMRQRCLDPNCKEFPNYGGRGITITKEWDSFEGFKNDMGSSFRQELTLDRIDNNKGYSKQNCRWVDMTAQANNKRNNNLIEYHGLTKTIPQWARIIGIKRSTLAQRLYCYQWSVEQAFTTPVRERRVNWQ